MASTDRINRMRRRMRRSAAEQAVTVPPDYKATSTEKRSAELMVRALETDGEPVPPALQATAAAPVRGRVLSADEQVEAVRFALHCIRADAGECTDPAEKTGLLRAHETLRAALAGER